MAALQDYTRLKRGRRRRTAGELAWSLVLDSWSSPPRPRSAGSTTARPASDARARPRRAAGPGAPSRDRGGQPMTAVLELDQVTRIHGEGATEVHALKSVSFPAYAGELVAVMGPSGSGKSTLLTLAGGLDAPTSGVVLVEGTDLATLGQKGRARMRRTSIGYVFQDFNLIPALTAAENVALPRELDGVRTGAPGRPPCQALAEVGIEDLADRFPDEMSGGQQQRVAIARAIVGERRLILADEPTGALDTDTGEDILRLLRARCDAGAAGVLVTHEARHAAWADRVVFLRDGVVVDESGADRVETLVEGLADWPAGSRRCASPGATRGARGAQHPGAGDDRPAGARRERRRRGLPDLRRHGRRGARPPAGLGRRAGRVSPGLGRVIQAVRPGPGASGARGPRPAASRSTVSETLDRDVPATQRVDGHVRSTPSGE